MVKKTITICDICKRDEEEDNEAEHKCILCKKDICDDCWINYCIDIGEEDNMSDGRIEFIICRDCDDEVIMDKKKDKQFLDKIEKEVIEYLKQKVMLGELEKN